MDSDNFYATLNRLETSRVEYLIGRLGEVGLTSSEDQLAAGQRRLTELLNEGELDALERYESGEESGYIVPSNPLDIAQGEFIQHLEKLFLPVPGTYLEYTLYDLTDELLAVAWSHTTENGVTFEIIEGSYSNGTYTPSKRSEEFKDGQPVKITELPFTAEDASVLSRSVQQLNEIAGILKAESANKRA